jgi:hypothetical protein
MPKQTLEKAEREIQNGRLWRAKEILSGSIPNAGYDVVLFEKLGQVLLLMNDLPLAGKYLFLSGVRVSEYTDAINLFHARNLQKGARHAIDALPASIRKLPLADYPVTVATELKAIGVKDKTMKEIIVKDESTISERLATMGCLSVLILMIILMVMGLYKLSELIKNGLVH